MRVQHWLAIAVIALACGGVLFEMGMQRAAQAPSAAQSPITAPLRMTGRNVTYSGSRASVEAAAMARSLRGVVRARAGGVLAGVTVCWVKASGEVDPSSGCVDTNTAGQFDIPELPADARAILASAAGYRPRREVLLSDTSSVDLVLDLDSGAPTLAGRVVDALGGPVVGALVTFRGAAESVIAVAASAADGSFSSSKARAAVQVCAEADAYSRTCAALGAAGEQYVLVLTPASRILGRVRRRSDGSDIVGASVIASNRNGLLIPERTTTSGDDGTFSFDGLPAGGYELVAISKDSRSIAEWVAVGLGEVSNPLTLWSDPAVRVTTKVLASGAPCTSGSVQLSGLTGAWVPVEQNGSAYLDGIVPGRYEVTARCDGARFQSVSLDVRSAPLLHVFQLEPLKDSPSTPRGTIRAGIEGEPMAALAASIESEDGSLQRAYQRGSEFIFEAVPIGEYRAYVSDHVELARRVRIGREGEVAHVTLTAAAPAWIAGTVTNAEGVPVADAWVSVLRADLLPAPLGAPPMLTGAEGTFRLAAVPGAQYTLKVASPLGDAALQAVGAGEDITVRVQAPASLSGRVRSAQGGPVPEFTLTYRLESDATGQGYEGGNSSFYLPMLEPGTYALQVSSPLGDAVENIQLDPHQAAAITLTLSDAQASTIH